MTVPAEAITTPYDLSFGPVLSVLIVHVILNAPTIHFDQEQGSNLSDEALSTPPSPIPL
jgi:hypothetical protein